MPRGEVGILVRVEPAARVLGTPHCFVVMQWNQQEYFRSLYCDEENFLLEIVELLRSYAGRPIAEIGSVDIP